MALADLVRHAPPNTDAWHRRVAVLLSGSEQDRFALCCHLKAADVHQLRLVR
jgi:hypothetical protein